MLASASVAGLAVTALTLLGPVGAADAVPAAVTGSAAKAPKCKGRVATIVGTDGADTLRGTGKRDVILALGGDDRVVGRGGNDVICGGSGRDLIDGGPGDDKLFGGADGRSDTLNDDGLALVVGDVIQGGKGDDLIDLGYDPRQAAVGSAQRDRLSYKGAARGVTVKLGDFKRRGEARGEGHDVLAKHQYLAVLGSSQGDTILGSPWGDQIFGRGGPDEINGSGGRDVLVDGVAGVRSGNDVLNGGIGKDELTSYGGHDRLDGGASGDTFTAVRPPDGDLTLVGGAGKDLFTVSAMVARSCVDVDGGVGDDELVPTVARSVRRGKVDADLQSGAFGVRGSGGDGCGIIRGIERLTLDNPYGAAQRLRWFVRGTGVAETVVLTRGGSVLATMKGGDDRVVGSTGNDNMKGGPGDDRLFGGPGRDVAMGGIGTDTCREVEFKKGCEIPS